MSLQSGAAKLGGARKDLLLQWEQTKQAWHDVNARAFEKQYLQEWEAVLHRSHRAMSGLAATLQKLQRDCG
jgi:hypothetical protein